jgi:hypothetical protein
MSEGVVLDNGTLNIKLSQAFLAEYALVANKVKLGLETKISELSLDLNETQEELNSSTSTIKGLEARVAELERLEQDNSLAYKKRVSADAPIIEFLTGEKKNLHTLLGEANRLRHGRSFVKPLPTQKQKPLESNFQQPTTRVHRCDNLQTL